jgi:hypothetical protein
MKARLTRLIEMVLEQRLYATVLRMVAVAILVSVPLSDPEARHPIARSLAAGVYLADILTWIAFSVIDLPSHLRFLSIDLAVNLIAAALMLKYGDMQSAFVDGQAITFSFVAFMPTLAAKTVAWWIVRW